MIITKNTYNSLLLFTAIFMVSCTETIDLSLNTTARKLVVDAVISNKPNVQVVKLSWSGSYFSTNELPPVSGATVTIQEGQKIFTLRESTKNPGYYYILPEDFVPEPGKTYNLIIADLDLDENGEPEIYTSTTTMPQTVKIDFIDLKYQYFNDDWEIWQVLVYYQDPPAIQNNYMFRISQNENSFTKRPSDIRISNDKFFDGNYVNGLWVQSIDAREEYRQLEEGDIITLDLGSITKEYYEFLEAIKMDEQGSDPLFNGPPSNVTGNISNGALGFFTALSSSTAEVVYNPAKHD